MDVWGALRPLSLQSSFWGAVAVGFGRKVLSPCCEVSEVADGALDPCSSTVFNQPLPSVAGKARKKSVPVIGCFGFYPDIVTLGTNSSLTCCWGHRCSRGALFPLAVGPFQQDLAPLWAQIPGGQQTAMPLSAQKGVFGSCDAAPKSSQGH